MNNFNYLIFFLIRLKAISKNEQIDDTIYTVKQLKTLNDDYLNVSFISIFFKIDIVQS